MTLMQVELDDKYRLESKRIYLSGTQALVRLPMLQRERDRLEQLNTGGFISGYRGSPLGTYDQALWRAKSFLQQHDIAFVPGLNEDLAATAVWGSQQLGLFPGSKVDGVFGIWYGKGPGVDRSVDALKHANSAGTSRHGGVLAVAGDDHGGVSSTMAQQSEQVFAAALIPVINPATLQDYLDLGLYGFALSRFAGTWVGFKAIGETVESSASIDSDPARIQIRLPDDFEMPPGGLNIRWPDPPLEAEKRLFGPKMAAVQAFARANKLDRIVLDSKPARLGILATGKAYLDLRQALADLGISDEDAQELGLRIYKVALTWPLEESGARLFAEGLQDVLVVEEKRGFIEEQLMRILYHLDASKRPSIAGKRDEDGAPLLPSDGELTPTMVAAALVSRLRRLGHRSPLLEQRLARLESFEKPIAGSAPITVSRTPFFCSGCPHNTSTRVPEDSRALAGIGCHGMAMAMPSRRTATMTHMGAEGANWIGQAPFTNEKHIFQNLGDGTYTHSGLLALRAAVASGINITYKILYNDAVAMTGGQPAEGGFNVAQIAHQVWAEGIKRLVIVSDDPGKYPAGFFPSGATVHHRREMDALQRELRDIQGLTVLIYDQTCAAEKRRRRKRGLYPDPPKRVFINDLVCEGCGDCSQVSNCVSVQPLETEFGRKRQIDQSNCNKDYSCVEGFCPSFVTVHGGSLKRPKNSAVDSGKLFADLPLPTTPPLDKPYNILVTGVGGTGVITVGALLGMAAHVDGKGCSTLDFTGLSQKNGAVMSHVRIASRPEDISAVRITKGGADVILGCDMVVSAGPTALSRAERGKTKAYINADVQPTASFVQNPDLDFETDAMQDALRMAIGDNNLQILDATGMAAALMGDSIATNPFILGFAFQMGAIPLSLEALLRAFEINGTAVEMNKLAFTWGRLAAHDASRVRSVLQFKSRTSAPIKSLDEIIATRAEFLTGYQDQAYANRYVAAVAKVRKAETDALPSSTELTEAVAKTLFKLMAYKDEYEVARLYTDGSFAKKLSEKFDGDFTLKFNLAPPILARRDKATGRPQKQEFGGWMIYVFRLLARLKFLRGTAFDPFCRTEERRTERQLIADYLAMIDQRIVGLKAQQITLLARLARVPEKIRGFGHVKEASVKQAAAETARLTAELENSRMSVAAAE
ncbi:indolepyruvate ferredoxin oxidoreductase [Bradyrhizobium centrolobii]|uniref:Indolepyruvate ferredoxin oxidoreductase n=1 Tax=Bradyrhizobium centrolobii TaxID=1505087 RepID=A0A176YP65_9BRAD|nr:indolepyruvate ferredoxin oxidoreductase family protein [Bradyrhizobium centrolobii]OAF08590.1 indolepyruvate ferredoxin oxidoreductase [Bradyrhizobium centrolobii]